jgi:hypothetical protein
MLDKGGMANVYLRPFKKSFSSELIASDELINH